MREIASEGARWDFGLLSNMPTPEAYEPRVGLAVHLAIFNQGCEPEGVFINLTIQLKNAPSSEPVAGEWRVPYAVFKPIKDGINNWVRGIATSINNALNEYESSSSGGTKGEGEGSISDSGANNVINAIFGTFIDILSILFIILECVMTIISPFISIVASLIGDAVDFLIPMIMTALGSAMGDAGEIIKNIATSAASGIVEGLKLIFGTDGGKALILGFLSVLVGKKAISDATDDRTKWNSKYALIISLIGVTISAFSFIFDQIEGRSYGPLILASFGLVIALVGWGISLLMLADNPGWFGLIALGVGSACAFFAYKSFDNGIKSAFDG